MRRADRLFQIVQYLRRHRTVTAAQLAEHLEVSERTIYRDVRDLVASGVPIRGEAGVGYALHRGFDLPPLMFDREEIEALVLGARIVQQCADPQLARAAERVLSKVETVLPERLRTHINDSTLYAPMHLVSKEVSDALTVLRTAIQSQIYVKFAYVDRFNVPTERVVQPLGLFYWGRVWSLGAWCELRSDFRNFRVDRLQRLVLTDRVFESTPGRTINDMLTYNDSNDGRSENGNAELKN